MLDTLKKFFYFCAEKERKQFYLSIFLGVAAALFSALKLPAIGVLLSGLLAGRITLGTIFSSFGIMVLSVAGASLLKYNATALQTKAGYTTAANKRVEIAACLRYLPMGYFQANGLGKITSVTTNTMENLSDVATRVVMLVTEGIFSTAVMTLAVFCFDLRIGLFILGGLLLYYGVNRLLQRASRRTTAEKTKSDTVVVERVLEYLKGIAEVKAYGLSGKYNRRMSAAIDENAAANIGMELKLLPLMLLQSALAKLIDVGVIVLSLVFYTGGSMDLFYCIMMVICSFLITEGLEQAGKQSALLRVAATCVDKANEILTLPAMDISGEKKSPVNDELCAREIDFSYDRKKIIDRVSVMIPPHQVTAVVGPSGSGKTTLCHLLSRFWDVDRGVVTLGGEDVRSYRMDSLMENFSFVFQNVYLFHDTVANNIRFGCPDASPEQVIACAKKACCHDFIMKLPQGYDTVIGEAGGTLSGGERQRLSIARAMLKDAPIVILDEATANIDPENENELMKAFSALTREKTVIMIAHRLKTVGHAHQILVMDQGRIVQQGTHKELMKEEGIYRNFVGSRKDVLSWHIARRAR